MNFRQKLSQRIQMDDIREGISYIQGNASRIQALHDLVFDEDDKLAYQAAWILTHLSGADHRHLISKQEALIDEVLVCEHPGKRRLLLALLYRQTLASPPRTDFLDFCLARMIAKEELPGVQTLCMKLAYELCRSIPELLQEYRITLELLDPGILPISLKTVRRKMLNACRTGKCQQQLSL